MNANREGVDANVPDVKSRLVAYLVVTAVVAPLTCVLPRVHRDHAATRVLIALYAVGALIGIAIVIRSMRRESRRLTDYDTEIHGVCPACGYDLRESPDRCPECGRDVGSGFQQTPRDRPPGANGTRAE